MDRRTVAKLLDRAGPRPAAFHRQALVPLEQPPAVVEMDEPYARVARPPAAAGKPGGPDQTQSGPATPLAGSVNKLADPAGRLFRVRRYARFGRLRDIRDRVGQLRLGTDVETSHLERLNATCRGCMAQRTRDPSRRRTPLRSSPGLCRDAYSWLGPHGSLPPGATPAMVAGLATEAWSGTR